MKQTPPRLAVKYAEDRIRHYWRKARVYGVFYYGANVFSLLMAVAPGIIYAVLQLYKSTTNDQTYNLIALSTVICSSIASFVASVLNFFVVRERFRDNKTVYYGLLAEFTLYKSGTGVYYKNPDAHLVMLSRITEQMSVKDPREFDPDRKVWHKNGRH